MFFDHRVCTCSYCVLACCFFLSCLQPLSPVILECPVTQEEGESDEEEEGEERPLVLDETQRSPDETTTDELMQSGEPLLPTQSTTVGLRASDAPAVRLPTAKYTPPRAKWSPTTPRDPMEKLVHMGFANRTLNNQLMVKHNNHLRAVINELLDNQDKL